MNFIEKRSIKIGDKEDIIDSIPIKIYDHQVQNVVKIEKQFFDKNGKAYLVTDSTGSGKTYTGLSVVYRFLLQGLTDILIVVPSDKKVNDWIDDANQFNIIITPLKNIRDPGFEVTCTTYSNFYQNNAILKRNFDLVIYDECHYLNQNAKGIETVYLNKHKKIVKTPSVSRSIAEKEYPLPEDMNDSLKVNEWIKNFKEKTFEIYNKTKVLYMSATPFAYHHSIKYVDGTLLTIEENFTNKVFDENPFDKFLIENFQYRKIAGKLTAPSDSVDVDLLERSFFEKLKSYGLASNYKIEIDTDYSRDFILFDESLGQKIDQGIEMMSNPDFQKKYPHISENFLNAFNWLNTNMLLECMKARLIKDRVYYWLRKKFKVVIYHSYNNARIVHPFRFDNPEFKQLLPTELRWKHDYILKEFSDFKKEYPELVNLDLNFKNVREIIRDYIPNLLEFNGEIPKKKRNKNIELFNDPNSGYDVICIQQKAGREGISLHDKTGTPRVLINLGLPGEPTVFIQVEGRIYRFGTVTNCRYEYPIINTGFESMAFGHKISKRSKTAENLAMGNVARDLENAFLEGYKNPIEATDFSNDGTGGKDFDLKIFNSDEYETSKVFYKKRISKKKDKDFVIPEPLGFKMVQLLALQEHERVLEINPGIGTVARYLPKTTLNTFVEDRYKHFSRLSLVSTNGVFRNTSFDQFHIINKFEKFIIHGSINDRGKDVYLKLEKCLAKHTVNNRTIKVFFYIPNSFYVMNYLSSLLEKAKMNVVYQIILPLCLTDNTIISLFLISNFHIGDPVCLNFISLNEDEFFNQIKYL